MSLQAEDGKDERGERGEANGEVDQHDESSSWMTLTVVGHCDTYLRLREYIAKMTDVSSAGLLVHFLAFLRSVPVSASIMRLREGDGGKSSSDLIQAIMFSR
jgi:hypothetical protein